MVDLKGQYDKIKTEVDAAIQAVIDSTAFIQGQEVKSFQSELEQYLGVKHAIPCANGTDALQIALMALYLKPGDEVITTGFTFVATVEVLELLHLKPVIVDVEETTFNIDPAAIEKAITPKTKAIVPVHLFGQCAAMERILSMASAHGIFVIEDAAQAIGSTYKFSDGTSKKACNLGHMAATSFFPSKNLGAYGDAGAMFTGSDELAAKIRSIANHGMQVHYHYDRVGVNSRLDTLQAAILRVKLKRLDEYSAARAQAASFYDKAFRGHPGIVVPARATYSSHIFHQYTIRVKEAVRDGLKQYLSDNHIPSMVYYPVPLHLQKAYQHLGYAAGSFPVTERLCHSVLSLPMHTELDEEQLQHITGKVLEYLG